MPVMTMFTGSYCNEEPVVQETISITGYRLARDEDVIARASQTSGMGESKLAKAFSARTSVFNKFTHEKERSIAHMRLALADILLEDNFLIRGFTAHLVPREVSHALRVCIIADMSYRVSLALQEHPLSEKEALKRIRKDDEDRALWVRSLAGRDDPWDPSLYDIVVPMDKKNPREAAFLMAKSVAAEALRVTPESEATVRDFLVAARVEVALAEEGHHVGVNARNGHAILTINKHVLMLSRLEDELRSVAERVPGVTSVETKVGKDFYQPDVYRKFDFELPSKVLLVDDEREFVQALSERLQMRDMGSAVAYDGESALNMVSEDEPEVMILDLKMPGIDGIEVLRRVKATRPEIEVIILTGHGSDADRETCMRLGAFAYLQKPVDIDVLSDTLKKANEKIRLTKESAKRQGKG
ncbi:MAG: response regulator [Deltaproteobacteria bacterium]|nr:response regulator [Deltaproteobacteria bacterium]